MINASVGAISMEPIGTFPEDVDIDPLHFSSTKQRKQTIPGTPDPNSPSLSTHNASGMASPPFPATNGAIHSVAFKMERTQSERSEDHKEKSKEEKGDKQMKAEKQPVAECTMKEKQPVAEC